jgi:hypothetical protein
MTCARSFARYASHPESELHTACNCCENNCRTRPASKLRSMHLAHRIERSRQCQRDKRHEVYPPLRRRANSSNHSKPMPKRFDRAADSCDQCKEKNDRLRKAHETSKSI